MTSRDEAGYIGAGIRIRGRLSGGGDVEIEGLIEGDIGVDGEVVIAEAGRVIGPVRARDLVVAGSVRGDARASRVHVRDRGVLQGNVFAERVALDDGGTIDGIVEMDFELPTRERR